MRTKDSRYVTAVAILMHGSEKRTERGAAAIEYGLLAALVGVALFAGASLGIP